VSTPVLVAMPVSVSVSVSASVSVPESGPVRMCAMCLYVVSFAPTFVSVCIHNGPHQNQRLSRCLFFLYIGLLCVYTGRVCSYICLFHTEKSPHQKQRRSQGPFYVHIGEKVK